MLSHVDTFLFDLDGTLTVPMIDFAAMRRRLELPDGVSITHALRAMPEADRERGFKIVQEVELEAAMAAQAAPGAIELLRWLDAQGHAVAIVTRNFGEAVRITLEVTGLHVDVVITRDCAPPKPAPDPVHEALRRLGRSAATALMVGDYTDDISAGRAAGTITCLVTNGGDAITEADLVVPWLVDLHRMLQK